MKKSFLFNLMAFALVAVFAGFAQGQQKFVAAMNGIQMVPPNSSTARAHCTVTYLVTTREELQFDCEFSGLSGGITQFGIHTAPIGQSAVTNIYTFYISGPTSGTIQAAVYNQPYEAPLRSKQIFLDLHSVGYPNGELRGQVKPFTLDSDLDGDSRMDAFVFRPSNTYSYALGSMNNAMLTHKFDKLVNDSDPFLVDFDGDGIADYSFIRTDAITGAMTTFYVASNTGDVHQVAWGNVNLSDKPVYGDYDRDGKMDVAVYRTANGVWYILQSSDGQPRYEAWGQPNNDLPCPGDYDKDGKADLCVVRPESGQLAWYIRQSATGAFTRNVWGLSTDSILPNYPADVDGDGANDLLIKREEGGQHVYYALRSSDHSWTVVRWGLSSDGIRLGDFDGDNKTDYAALRNVGGYLLWYVYQSSNGQMRVFNWGLAGDK